MVLMLSNGTELDNKRKDTMPLSQMYLDVYLFETEKARQKYLRLKEKKRLNTTLHHDYSMSEEMEKLHKLHVIKLDIERQRAQQDKVTRCTCPDCVHSTISQCSLAACKCCLTQPLPDYRGGWGMIG